jgi:hypothetical protein
MTTAMTTTIVTAMTTTIATATTTIATATTTTTTATATATTTTASASATMTTTATATVTTATPRTTTAATTSTTVPPTRPAMAPATRAVELVGGMNVTARRLIYTRDVDLDAPPTPYLGTPVASAMIDATVYPLAFSGKPSLVRNLLGVRLLLDRSLMLKNQLTIGNDVTTLSGKQQHLAIGAALRFGIGKAAVIGRLEYHRFTYELGKTDMQVDIPDVGYRYEEFGVSARLPVGDRAVAGFDGGLMLLNTAGEIQHLDWYGGGTALGYNAQASIEARLVKKLTLRVALHVASIGIDFAGVGDLATGRDNDMQQDVHSVQDTYFGGNAGLGWMF